MSVSKITAIEPQTRHRGRFNIFVDGEFAVGLAEAVVASLSLKVGQVITAEALLQATAAEERFQARDAAYRLLSFRARSEKEIRDRLKQKGYEATLINETILSLRESGLLNDEAFATSWVVSRGRTRGSRALTKELRAKGVNSETIAETLTETRDTDTEQQAALTVAIKRVGERPVDASREAQSRLAAYLQRRGFGWEVIRPVLRTLYHETPDETTD